MKDLTLEQIDKQIALLEQQKQSLISRKNEQTRSFETEEKRRKVVVIGGQGQLGRLFVELFKASNYQVEIFEKDDWALSQGELIDFFVDVDLVLLAVPIHLTLALIDKLVFLPRDCVLADITSIKEKPLAKMLSVHSGPVVGLHPMFGPDVIDLKNQTIVICHGRQTENYNWWIQQLVEWQANLHITEAKKHDATMAIVQVLRHFSTVAYGAHLAGEDVCLKDVVAMSSPIYRLELAMVGRLFAQDPDLYTEIIFANPQNIEMMQRYIRQFDDLLTLLKSKDKKVFKQVFLDTRAWFGDYADRFLEESSHMLASTTKEKKN